MSWGLAEVTAFTAFVAAVVGLLAAVRELIASKRALALKDEDLARKDERITQLEESHASELARRDDRITALAEAHTSEIRLRDERERIRDERDRLLEILAGPKLDEILEQQRRTFETAVERLEAEAEDARSRRNELGEEIARLEREGQGQAAGLKDLRLQVAQLDRQADDRQLEADQLRRARRASATHVPDTSDDSLLRKLRLVCDEFEDEDAEIEEFIIRSASYGPGLWPIELATMIERGWLVRTNGKLRIAEVGRSAAEAV